MATILGLLLVVTFIAQEILIPLPHTMAGLEYEHELQLENQLGRLQAVLLAQAAHPQHPLSLDSPVTLGSLSNPPFGHGDGGAISEFGYPASDAISVSVPSPPSWGNGSLCSTSTSTSCSESASNVCNPGLTWNESASNVSYTFSLTGSNNCEAVNITGNHDTFTLGVTGSNLGYFILNVSGSNDTIVLNNHYSGSGFHSFIYFFGGYDSFEGLNGPTGSGVFLNIYFIGESTRSGFCPYGNLASTDTWSITGSSSSNSLLNLTWYNFVGYSTPYHLTNGWPGSGNSGSGDHVGWKNISQPISCPFTALRQMGSGWGGISVLAGNAYSAPATVALDSGAVVYSESGGGSYMVDPPPWQLFTLPGGTTTMSIILFAFITSGITSTSGTETAGVQTEPVSVHTASLVTGSFSLSLTTAYPQAWLEYLDSPASGAVAGSQSCTVPTGTCLSAPAGTMATVGATFSVGTLTITYAVFTVSIN